MNTTGHGDTAGSHSPNAERLRIAMGWEQLPTMTPEQRAESDAANAWADAAARVLYGRGDWMQTFTGRAFYPMDPRPDEVDPRDIAHALSMVCRFGGHLTDFYSVAEHCVLMSHAVDPEDALWALMHDAAEAYLGDLVRPVKYALPNYRAVEHHLLQVIAERFGLGWPCPPSIKVADMRMLRTERDTLMGPPPMPWTSTENVEPFDVPILGWRPERAERVFLDRMRELFGGRL